MVEDGVYLHDWTRLIGVDGKATDNSSICQGHEIISEVFGDVYVG